MKIPFAIVTCIALVLGSCSTKSGDELELMSKDVLKAKQGIEIDIKPLDKIPSNSVSK